MAEILDIKGKFIEESCNALKNRLRRIISGSGGRVWNVTTSNVSMDMLLDNNVIIDMSAYEAAEDTTGRQVLLDIIAHLMYNYLAKTRSAIHELGQDKLQNMILADESQKLVPRKLTKRFTDESSLFAKLPQTVRAFGVSMMWAGVTPTVEPTVISQAGTSIIFFSKDHHDLQLMSSLVGLEEDEFNKIVNTLQPREAIVRTPRSSAYIIRTMDTPVKKMTAKDWDRQRGNWVQENIRSLYEQTAFSLAPKFQEEEGSSGPEWNYRKICQEMCLAGDQCIEVGTIAVQRAAKMKKDKTLRELLVEDLKSSDSDDLKFAWMRIVREAEKDSKQTPVGWPVQAFCTAMQFLRVIKDDLSFSVENLDQLSRQLSHFAEVDNARYLKSLFKDQVEQETPQQTSPARSDPQEENNPVTPVEALARYLQGNIEKYGFVMRPEAKEFYQRQNIDKMGKFSQRLNSAIQRVRKEVSFKIARVGVPSLASKQNIMLFAKENDPKRENSWDIAVHRYFITQIGKACEDLGHSLENHHALPNGKKNDLYVRSGRTNHSGHIEIKTGATVVKKDIPETDEPFLLIAPWNSRRGKSVKVGRNHLPIPLGEADHLRRVINGKGENYSVLAADDPEFRQKLDAWIDTGKLSRVLNDSAH